MARTIALGIVCRVIVGYVVIGRPEPALVFYGSDTISAHGVTISVRSNAFSPPAIERVAIGCERVVLRKPNSIVLPARTRIVVLESASLVAISGRRVRDSAWCGEHVYARQQSDVQVTRNATYTWMYTVVR